MIHRCQQGQDARWVAGTRETEPRGACPSLTPGNPVAFPQHKDYIHEMKNFTALAPLSVSLVLLLLLIPATGSARDRGIYAPFWWALEMGYGNVTISDDDRSSQDAFYLGFKGGIMVDESLRIGVEANSWTMESEDTWDSDRGEGVTQYGIVAMLNPPDTPLQLTGSFDYVDYWNNRFPEFDGQGWSGTMGIGYCFLTDIGLAVTPSISYTFGRIRDDDAYYYDSESRDLDIVTIKVGLSFNPGGHHRYRDWDDDDW
jgi:hypothetical protein